MTIGTSVRAGRWSIVLCIITIIVFVGAAGAKLAGAREMIDLFGKIGLGQGFRYFTALCEIAGAVGLIFTPTRRLAATALAAMMICAIGVHLFIVGGNPVPAIALGLICGTLAIKDR
jgi:hypothetical protein